MNLEQAVRAQAQETAPQDLSRLLVTSNATRRSSRNKKATTEEGATEKGMQRA
jgi:hypothetical protein